MKKNKSITRPAAVRLKKLVSKRLLNTCMFSLACMIAVAQNSIQVNGTVTDDKGTPLAGASVTLKGTINGTTADNKGTFLFTIKQPGTLIFSYAGYESKEIKIISSQTLNVSLTSNNVLSDVVVTGYSRQSKRDVTGAASTVSADVIAKTPVADVTTALQGRVAGVNVDDQGGPGNPAVIRIRGVGSLGNNDPLYVIDGVQVRIGGSVGSQNIAALLNPNDIESITILKDPSLTTLYGSAGSNGVIVITTKSGKRGEPQLEYSTYFGEELPRKFPTMVTPQQQADALYQSYVNSGQSFPYGSFYGSGTKPVLPDYIVEGPTPNLGVAAGDPRADPSLYNFSTYRILKANKQGTNWWNTVFNPAFTQNHQLSLSGASDKGNYAISFGYLGDNGSLINSYFKRLSFRANTDFKIKSWLRLGENFEFAYTTNNTISTSNEDNNQGDFHNNITDIYAISPLMPAYDIAGNTSGTNGVSAIMGGSNPLTSRLHADDSKNYTEAIIGSAYIEVEPYKNLTLNSKIGVQFIPNQYHSFVDSFPQEPIPSHTTYYYEGSSYYTDWRWTNKLAYNITINSIHKISAFVAYEANEYTSRYNGIVMTNLISGSPDFQYVGSGVLDPNFPPSGGGDKATSVSTFGNVTYSLMDKYLLSGTLRHDGSSVFGGLSHYGTFPAASAGWRISEEKFMEDMKWISDLKLRASWGKAGNNAIPPQAANTLYRQNDNIYGGYDLAGTNISQVVGAYGSQLGNPHIHWESNNTTNIGFDAAFINNRLTASFNWYNRKTSDLLYQPPSPGTAGAASPPYENIMSFTNKGIELEVGFKSGKSKLGYDMNFNISAYKSNVDFINGDSTDHIDLAIFAPTHYNLTRSQVGHPVSEFYGYIQEGIFQSGDDYTKYGVTQPGLTADNAAGHFKFKDISGPDGKPDGVINEYDQTFLGNPNPKFSFGYNLDLYYKNFDFGIFIQGVVGNKIFNYWRSFTQWPGYLDARSLDTWSPENTNAKLPVYTQDAINSNYDAIPSSFFVENGSYVRLKTVQFGYTFPKTKAFKGLRVYVQGFNLITITKYSGLDPEVNNGNPGTLGIDFGNAYPNAQKLLFGINFNL
ncbi:MAG: TonB-dependent receptor [Parafilimonas sp.]|nr:TonB-dependent receptor [Parafilimonas sp.]